MKKYTAGQYFTVSLVDVSTGASWNGTAYGVYKGDNGTLTQCANSITQTTITVSGIVIYEYTYSPTQAETNFDHVTFTIFGTGAVPRDVHFVTGFPQTADVGAGATLTSAYDAAKTAASQASVNAIPTTPLLAANYTAPDNTGITNIYNRIGLNGAGLTAIGDARMANLDAAISTRMASFTYTAPDNSSITAIKVKTDNLPIDPASNTQVATRMASFTYTSPPSASANAAAVRVELATELGRMDASITSRMASFTYSSPPSVADIWGYNSRTLTDKLGFAPSFSQNASAVRTELTTELARLDAAISSRLAESGYTVPPTSSANATAVRSELATELSRLDAAMSSRLAASQYTAPDNAGIAVIELNLALALGTGFDSATDSLNQLKVSLGGMDTKITAIPNVGEIENAVLNAAMADHATAGTIGAGIRAAGNLGDPLGLTVVELQRYDPLTYASLILKLNVGEPTEPVVPIPAPSLSVDDCIVYIDIKGSINVPITFKLSETARKNGVVLTETRTAYTDTLGRAVIALCRTDKMTPSGVFYKVTCEALHWHQKPLELTTSIFNLADLITDG